MNAMTYEEMLHVEGGLWGITNKDIDKACAVAGVGGLVFGIYPVAAFCAGWGLGRTFG